MDYRKIILYLILILAALGFWHKSRHDDKKQADKAERFASVYAGTSVMAELLRHDPQRFFRARDSICNVHNFNADSIEAFRLTFENREEEWNDIWLIIKIKTDSLIAHFRANPIMTGNDTIPDMSDSALPQ